MYWAMAVGDMRACHLPRRPVFDLAKLDCQDEHLTLGGIIASDGRKMFVAAAHTDDDIAQPLELFGDALRELAS